MDAAVLWWRSCVRHLEHIDVDAKLRLLRRYPRRRVIAVIVALLLFVIFFLRSGKSAGYQSPARVCVNDRLKFYSKMIEEFDVGVSDDAVKFVGNGHFGVDADGQLRFSSNGSRVLDFSTGFVPTVSSDIETSSEVAESDLTDFSKGIWRRIKCYVTDGDCACVVVSQYAHRTRSNVFVQDIQVINPTKTTVRIKAERPEPVDGWTTTKSGDASVSTRTFSDSPGVSLSSAVVCTNPPEKLIVFQKREETIRFICVVSQKRSALLSRASQETVNNDRIRKELSTQVLNEFSTIRGSTILDSEHWNGWLKLHSAFFSLSPSKAPDVLNGDRINATFYALLSHTTAPTLDHDVSPDVVIKLEQSARRNELCYSGHSTLLYPSRLWEGWETMDKMTSLVEVWLLTLEKRGCANVLLNGAVGLAQSFVQSLAAASYHDSHLEVGLDASDLHREMTFGGIPIGVVGTVTVEVKIDVDNRPFFMISSSAQLFACDGGCLDTPITLTRTPTKIPVKVTKPVTSLLYVATNRRHLEQLKSAIHVAEVGAAPAHEKELLELHRSGESGGLPNWFWILLIIVLIAFHAFLAKLLWNEWRKGDMTPYNPYLRNRYSYVRAH